MTDTLKPGTSPDDAALEQLNAQKADSLRASALVPGVSVSEEEAYRAQSEVTPDKMTAAARFGLGSLEGYKYSTLLGKAEDLAIDMGPKGALDYTASQIKKALINKSTYLADPNWSPAEKPDQAEQLRQLVAGLPEDAAEDVYGQASYGAAVYTAQKARDEVDAQQRVSEMGLMGKAGYFIGSAMDIDAPLAIGGWNYVVKVSRLKKIEEAVKAGKLTEDMAKTARETAQYGVTGGENLLFGAEAGLTASAISQPIQAAQRPTYTAGDAWGTILMSTAFGAGLGAFSPTSNLQAAFKGAMDSVDLAKRIKASRGLMTQFTDRATPRGIRNNNPGNIVFNENNPWQGQTGKEPNGRFAQFSDAESGIRAMHQVLQAYTDRGISTIRGMINTYAPSIENNTDAYVNAVARDTGIDPDVPIDINDMPTAERVVSAIIKHENGGNPYSPEQIREGITRSIDPTHEPAYYRSVGAAGTTRGEFKFTPAAAEKIDIVDRFFNDHQEVAAELFNNEVFGDSMVQQLAKHIKDGIDKTPFMLDYDRLSSFGPTGKYLAYNMLESAIGIARNRRSANNLANHINESINADVSPFYGPIYHQWAQAKGISPLSRYYHIDGEYEFMREFKDEMERRYHNDPSPSTASKPVQAMADRMDAANRRALAYAKGEDGGIAMEGMADVEFKSGWVRRLWRGDKMVKVEREIGTDRLVDAIATGIMKATPETDVDMATILAKSIVRRVRDKDAGSAFGAFGSVSKDGKAFMAQALKDHSPNLTDEEAMATIEKVFGTNPERGLQSYARRRLEIDMRTQIPGTNYRLMDLTEDDLLAQQEKYFRSVAGASALARKGIQRTDIPSWTAAVIEEARSLGTYQPGMEKFIQDIFSYYGDGAFAGGAGPIVGRLNKLAFMAYLGTLGITQIAEVGAQIGVSGLKAWAHYAKQTLPEMLRGKDPEALKSLAAIGYNHEDHRLLVRALSVDEADLSSQVKLLRGLDRLSDKGMRALGYASGFFKVTSMMNAMAGLTVQDYIVRHVRDGAKEARLRDIGVDADMAARVRKYIDDGTIEFTPEGYVKTMNYDRWDPIDKEDMVLALKTHVRQVVQKPNRGETASWMHKEFGSLFMSLKNFTILAGQKQVLRNMRHADEEAVMTVLYGTGTAAMAFAARQALNGNLDNMDTRDLAIGAMQWGNMTSPLLMVADPLSYLLGADRIPGSPFPLNEWKYGKSGLVGAPAGISALDDILKLARVPSDVIDDGELTNDSISSLKAIPVLGRSYPMIPILNALGKDD